VLGTIASWAGAAHIEIQALNVSFHAVQFLCKSDRYKWKKEDWVSALLQLIGQITLYKLWIWLQSWCGHVCTCHNIP
jgi:hypothetical protein